MSHMLEMAKNAALKAGKNLMELYSTEIDIEKKPDKSFVTEADLRCEKAIVEEIKKCYPQHSIHAEESGKDNQSSEFCWYIDPLDGTHNFLHKVPIFGISIAVAKNNKFMIGVIYIPHTDELFYAESGKGSFLNGKKIQVSKKKLKDALYYNPGSTVHNGEKIIQLAKIFLFKCHEIRMIGSCAVNLAYIAAGRGEFKILPGITPYDVGAGKVIIEEAGGKVTRMDGGDFLPEMKDYNLIASNNQFHNEIIKILKEELK